jgi:nitroimidazol reductase NimA-like FMN-containing flavoprotein (pyridoxamine 5'-phosphate oxidase superfamily)
MDSLGHESSERITIGKDDVTKRKEVYCLRSMRRKEKEVTDRNEMVRILLEARYVTIAMSDDDGPYLVTVTHGFDDERNALYFHCAQSGRKVDILKKDGRVWGQALVDLGYAEGSCDHLYKTTQFRGKVTFVDGVSEKRQALGIMIRKNEKDPERVISQQITDDTLKNVMIGRIDIDLMTCKRSDEVEVAA